MTAIIIILTLILISDAVGDGQRTRGNQVIHHFLEGVMIALFFAIIVIVNYNMLSGFELRWLLVYYLSLRLAGFDLIYNITAGNKWNYFGNSSLYDRLMKTYSFQFFKVLALITAICSIIRLVN